MKRLVPAPGKSMTKHGKPLGRRAGLGVIARGRCAMSLPALTEAST
jgi:hypothetical protein